MWFLFMKNWRLAGIVGALLIFWLHGWTVGTSQQIDREKENLLSFYERSNRKSADLEKEISAIREAGKKNKKDLEREIAKNPSYNSCRVPSDGVRLYNTAISAR